MNKTSADHYLKTLAVEIGKLDTKTGAIPPILLDSLMHLEATVNWLQEQLNEAHTAVDDVEKTLEVYPDNPTVKSLPDRIKNLSDTMSERIESADDDCEECEDCEDCDCEDCPDDLEECKEDYAELDEQNSQLEDRLERASYAISDYLKLPFNKWQDHHWFLASIGHELDPDRFKYDENMIPFDTEAE